MNYERIPKPPTLEDSAVSEIDMVTEVLCEYYEHSNGRALIDESYEMDYPSVVKFTDLLVEVLDMRTEQEWLSVYQSIHFSLYSAQLMGWKSASPSDLSDYFTHFKSGMTRDAIRDAITDDAQEYLAEKVVLNSLISTFMPEITSVPNAQQPCEAVAGLTYLQIEKRASARSEAATAADFATQLDKWDGQLPDDWQV